MKSILYISSAASRPNGAALPVDLAKIYRHARHHNARYNIRGILSYRSGYYIQVIQGDNQAIDNLYSKIANDNRHTNLEMIFDVAISEYTFENRSMKLIQNTKIDSEFNQFFDSNRHLVSELSYEKKILLGKFAHLRRSDAHLPSSYKGKAVKLIKWPNYTVLDQTTTVVELCSLIMQSERAYEFIVDSELYGTQSQINAVLDELKNQEILVVSDAPREAHKTPVKAETTPVKFYSKMKAFLSLRRSNGL